MIIPVEKILTKLFEKWAKEKKTHFFPLPPSGSSRKYYRLKSKTKTAIGVFYPNQKENIAFLNFSRHFFKKGLKVPQIYAQNLKKKIYLIQDLGDQTLFSVLVKKRKGKQIPESIIKIYIKIIRELVLFQTRGGVGLDYKVCYPREKFDKQSMLWDLNYFKYYFLKLAKIPFDEQKLEKNFQSFIKYLLSAKRNFFLYRDFQSRNIMIIRNSPYFIDYQGGRKGALQYDLASLLFDAKADLPIFLREKLLEHYLKEIKKKKIIKQEEFLKYFYPYALIRIMQAMGSYGFRGFYEGKNHFLQSIPYALENLNYVLNKIKLPKSNTYLVYLLKQLTKSPGLNSFKKFETNYLTVNINSFSYKNKIPQDTSGNGVGFIFDCRALDNPGRLKRYKHLDGNDGAVIKFFERKKDIKKFLKQVYSLISQSVENYQQRKFTNLMINFGCTGGQHRSVYCAEKLEKYLRKKYKNIKILVRHLEQEIR